MAISKKNEIDKQFLKKDEFADLVYRGIDFIQENIGLFIAAILVIVLATSGVFYWKYNQGQQVKEFNQKFYETQKSIKKEEGYRQLLDEYSNIPAAQLARLNLVDELLEKQKTDEAIKEIDAGLSKSESNSILTTLLVLKKIDILKSQKKFLEAATIAQTQGNHVLASFQDQLKLTQADLLLLAQKKDDARKVYEALAAEKPKTDSKNPDEDAFDSAAVTEAKNKLMLLDLGVI